MSKILRLGQNFATLNQQWNVTTRTWVCILRIVVRQFPAGFDSLKVILSNNAVHFDRSKMYVFAEHFTFRIWSFSSSSVTRGFTCRDSRMTQLDLKIVLKKYVSIGGMIAWTFFFVFCMVKSTIFDRMWKNWGWNKS